MSLSFLNRLDEGTLWVGPLDGDLGNEGSAPGRGSYYPEIVLRT
jgi:hypothetical protein